MADNQLRPPCRSESVLSVSDAAQIPCGARGFWEPRGQLPPAFSSQLGFASLTPNSLFAHHHHQIPHYISINIFFLLFSHSICITSVFTSIETHAGRPTRAGRSGRRRPDVAFGPDRDAKRGEYRELVRRRSRRAARAFRMEHSLDSRVRRSLSGSK